MKRAIFKYPGIFSLFFLMVFTGCNRNVGDSMPELILMDALAPPRYQVSGIVKKLDGTTNFQLKLTSDYSPVTGISLPTSIRRAKDFVDGCHVVEDPHSAKYCYRTRKSIALTGKEASESGDLNHNSID